MSTAQKSIAAIEKELAKVEKLAGSYNVLNGDISEVVRYFYKKDITFSVIPFNDKEVKLMPYHHIDLENKE